MAFTCNKSSDGYSPKNLFPPSRKPAIALRTMEDEAGKDRHDDDDNEEAKVLVSVCGSNALEPLVDRQLWASSIAGTMENLGRWWYSDTGNCFDYIDSSFAP